MGNWNHTRSLISFFNRVNEGDDLRFSKSKFQTCLALNGIEFNPYLFEVGM